MLVVQKNPVLRAALGPPSSRRHALSPRCRRPLSSCAARSIRSLDAVARSSLVMARKKKERRAVETSGPGGGPAATAAAATSAVVLAAFAVLLRSGGGCTDVSALNYSPHATRDDGSCVGSMYELSGVFEVKTVVPLQKSALGMEFDLVGNYVGVKSVSPMGHPAQFGVKVADELLAIRDGASDTVLVSGRGKAGLVEAEHKTAEARPGSTLTWVMRHGTDSGMSEA